MVSGVSRRPRSGSFARSSDSRKRGSIQLVDLQDAYASEPRRIKERMAITSDALIEEINEAYRRLRVAAEDLTSADRALAEHVRRVRLDNAEAILEAKNERTAGLYLDGLLDTDEHRRLEADRASAELDHQHAKREVERLHLIARVLGETEGQQR